jgi:transcriptional regulator with XRE-family HTH domain
MDDATDNRISRIGKGLWGTHWQAEMARELDQDKTTISSWKRDRMEPRPEKILRLREIAKRRRAELDAAIGEIDAWIETR